MKKVLSTIAALGLVAGLATTASAVEFKMSGHYMVEGAYLSDGSGNGIVPMDNGVMSTKADNYYLHTFEIKPTMQVNDKISMSSVIRLADDTFWGNQVGGDVNAGGSNVGGTGGDVEVWQLYMDYLSPIGKFKIGRTSAGAYGTAFRDFDSRANRVMLYPSFLASGPVSTLFYIEKATENTVVASQTSNDYDKYVARVYYKNDNIDSGFHYGYYNDLNTATHPAYEDHKHELSAYGKFKMDNFFVNAELTHFLGERDNVNPAVADNDFQSWAGMLQGGMKIDALTPSLMYFYAQGRERNSTDIDNALSTTGPTTGTGDLFEPLYILTGRHTGLLNNDLFDVGGDQYGMKRSGVHAIVAAADYAVSNDLSLHGAIGWAQADVVQIPGQDNSYGWEYNVGAAYKLLPNLTYEAHFGYLDAGDYFESNNVANDIKSENVYILTHSLTMAF